MIGYLQGEVLFCDGKEMILKTRDGIGHQLFINRLFPEGSIAEIFVSHIFKESGQELFGFCSLRDKKLFELLTSVKGCGPKSAFSLLTSLGAAAIIQAVQLENKKTLSQAPGIGPKAAAQICLDLGNKIQQVMMYAGQETAEVYLAGPHGSWTQGSFEEAAPVNESVLNDALMACKELGFKESQVLETARRILYENKIEKPEQLVHLVLKEV